MTLAVICGMILVTVICCIIGFGMLGSALTLGSSKPVLPKSGVMVIDMSKVRIAEQSEQYDQLASVTGGDNPEVVGIWDAVQAINAAATDPAVKFIYLKPDNSSTEIAPLQELRIALQNFRKTSGKPIVAYTESPTTGSYYLASVSDKVYMTSYLGASPTVVGVSTQMMFLGDLLSRLGVNVQLIRHGKYKSAGEMYTRSASSPENHEQYQRLVDSMWESLSKDIAASRGISVDELNDDINNLKLVNPQDFVDCKLVDELLSSDQLEDKLTVLDEASKFKDVKMFSLSDYVGANQISSKAGKAIAVIYADGEITDGSDRQNVAGDRFASIIAKVRADSTVKAVVLRVNSPGGSVIASEKIKHELDLLGKVKPLIASYGTYAASGGYWISNNCDKIFSDAITLTGSIGVFGMIPDFSKTAKNILHIGIESVSSNSHGDFGSMTRPLDKNELNAVQRSIEAVYDRFTTTVSEGRSIPKDTVDAIGQGRVWTGSDALKIKLVDQIGTLEDAVNYAAGIAGDQTLVNWNIKSYPYRENQLERIINLVRGTDTDESAIIKTYQDIKTPKILARMDSSIEVY